MQANEFYIWLALFCDMPIVREQVYMIETHIVTEKTHKHTHTRTYSIHTCQSAPARCTWLIQDVLEEMPVKEGQRQAESLTTRQVWLLWRARLDESGQGEPQSTGQVWELLCQNHGECPSMFPVSRSLPEQGSAGTGTPTPGVTSWQQPVMGKVITFSRWRVGAPRSPDRSEVHSPGPLNTWSWAPPPTPTHTFYPNQRTLIYQDIRSSVTTALKGG